MLEKEILVKVEGLSKKFCKDLKTSLDYGVKDLVSNLFGNQEERNLRDKEFWAVKDINFELRRGECLGLIGHNGAGKSTLLKILNGLIKPDAGRVTIRGRVGALIELGAGFNSILTGRENVYNNGAVLGFTRKEVEEKIEDIIDFSEIREFIDMPVQNYSSGMKVRLGFAIAAQMQPDVLLIDEVLAVGDLGFVLKCFKTIDAILPNTAIIFVSHNMPMISRICTEIILLERGVVNFQGKEVSIGIDRYFQRFITNEGANVVYTDHSLELKDAIIENVPYKKGLYSVAWGSRMNLNLTITNNSLYKIPYISLVIYDKEQRPVAEVFPDNQVLNNFEKQAKVTFQIQINNLYLSKGIYTITFNASEELGKNVYYKVHKIVTFQMEHEQQIWTSFLLDSQLIATNHSING